MEKFGSYYWRLLCTAYRSGKQWARDQVILAGSLTLIILIAGITLGLIPADQTWQRVISIVGSYAGLLLLCIIVHIVRTPWKMDATRVQDIDAKNHSIQKLQSELDELRDTRRPGLIGTLEVGHIAVIDREVWALFKIRIINQKAPSAADRWSVVAITKSEKYQGRLMEITSNQTVPGQYETITPANSIYHKAMSSPIPTGGNVSGWLGVGFGSVDLLELNNAQWEISFEDVMGERHLVELPPMSLPTMRTSQ